MKITAVRGRGIVSGLLQPALSYSPPSPRDVDAGRQRAPPDPQYFLAAARSPGHPFARIDGTVNTGDRPRVSQRCGPGLAWICPPPSRSCRVGKIAADLLASSPPHYRHPPVLSVTARR